MAARARDSGFPIIKIKLGASPAVATAGGADRPSHEGDDESIVAAIRAATDARLRVDANGGWTREQAAHLIPRLASHGVELVEQPLPAGDHDGLRWLRRRVPGIPIFADESVTSGADVIALAGAVDGVVVKLSKLGGFRETLRAIAVARALDMQVMVSCMIESSLGVTAAAHLAPLCDHADLDGPLLVANDPYDGLRYDKGRLILPERPGLGVRPQATATPPDAVNGL
jgi:L-alanine-DL-glutamate epimerase-like enolase superfamily enzyme